MTLRMPLVVSLWILCAVMGLPTTLSLSCYSCQDYLGSSQPCSTPSVHKCEVYHDSCMSTRTTLKFNGMRFTSTIKNCTASLLCHSSFICDKMNDQLATVNMKTESCSVSCCRGDLCNGGRAEPDGTGFTTEVPISTQYPTDDPSPKAEPDPAKYTTDGPIATEYPTDTPARLICYSCQDYPGSSQPCSKPSVIQCDNSQDSCISTVVTARMFGTSYTQTVKNCAISKYECNSSTTCAVMNNTLAGSGMDMQECSLSCCQGNLCNGPSGGGEPNPAIFPTDRPNLTDHPTDDTAPKTLSCYSCQDYPGSNQSCNNPSVIHCDKSQDSCMSTVVTARMFGTSYTQTVKNCATSKYQCDSSTTCGIMNNALAAAGLDIQNCSLSCCQGNLCNGPSGGAEPDPSGFTTVRPMSTDHPTDDPITKPLSCYSCQDYPGSSLPCSNPSVTQCDNSQDSCMSAVITMKMFGTMTVKKCSMAKYECNSSITCALMNNTLAGSGMDMQECSLSCCQGNLCNGPSGGGEPNPSGLITVKPMSTDHPTDDPTRKTLSCYSCQDYPGSSQPCSKPYVTQCNYSQDSCISTVVTARMFGTSYTQTEKKCAISKYECNSSTTCAIMNNTLAGSGMDMQECSLSCCQGNLCNGPSGGAEPDPIGFTTDRPNFTDHPTDDPIPKALSCYSCRDYPGSSQPCSNPSVTQCDNGEDSCMSVVVNASILGTRFTRTFKTCTISKSQCNSSLCADINETMAQDGLEMKDCLLSCCQGNLCNGPSGGAYPTKDPSTTGCDAVFNKIITSPGYPNEYPFGVASSFWVPIPHGMAMEITFNYFHMESDSSCRYDYLSIKNDNNTSFGKYCGFRSGHTVIVTGQFVQMSFHSDLNVNWRGYNLSFSAVPLRCLRPSTRQPTTNQPTSQAVSSLSCYSCKDYPYSNQPCSNHSVTQCSNDQDSCMSLVVTADMPFGTRETTIVKHCAISKYECNSSVVCGAVTNSLERAGLADYDECSLSCCQGNLCNGPSGEGYPTAKPDPTRFTTDRSTPTDHPTDYQVTEGCGKFSKNILTSPKYPQNYPPDMDCDYSVHIPYGMAMKITFNYFNLEDGGSSCKHDYLSIKNEKNQTFGKYCDIQSGRIVVVTGRYVKMTFHSDYSLSRKGYKLSFSAVPRVPGTLRPSTKRPTTQRPGCGAVSNNILTSPGYPNNYPNNMYCAYSVDIPHGMAMQVTFSYFNVEGLFDCKRRRFDYLIIKNDDNQDFGEYCGYVYSGHSVTVTGRYVKIIFSSDGFVSKKGYNLSFSAVPLATYTTFSLTRASSTKTPRSTSAPTVIGPTGCPTAGQGSDLESRLKCHIGHLRSLLNQMEGIVENDLGSISNINKRNQIERRVMKAIANLNAALKNAGRQKRDLSETMMVDQLKKKAADLISRLRNQQGQYKRKTQLKPREKKREAKGRQMVKKAAETISEKLFNKDKEKR